MFYREMKKNYIKCNVLNNLKTENKMSTTNTNYLKSTCIGLSLCSIIFSSNLQAKTPTFSDDYEDQIQRVAAALPGGNELKIKEIASNEYSEDFKNRKVVYRAEDIQEGGLFLKNRVSPVIGAVSAILFALPEPTSATKVAGLATLATSIGIQGTGYIIEWGGEKIEKKYLTKLSLSPSSNLIKMERERINQLKKVAHLEQKKERYLNIDENSKLYKLGKTLHLFNKESRIKSTTSQIKDLNKEMISLKIKLDKKIEKKSKEVFFANDQTSQNELWRNIYKYVSKSEFVESQIQEKDKFSLQIRQEKNEVVLKYLLKKNDEQYSLSSLSGS